MAKTKTSRKTPAERASARSEKRIAKAKKAVEEAESAVRSAETDLKQTEERVATDLEKSRSFAAEANQAKAKLPGLKRAVRKAKSAEKRKRASLGRLFANHGAKVRRG